MSATTSPTRQGSFLAGLEGSNLTEYEVEELLGLLLEELLEKQLRQTFQSHCRRPLHLLENRLRRMSRFAEKALNNG